MSKEEQAICVRTTRLNNLVLGNADAKAKASKPVTGALSREALLDTLNVLYAECDKDGVKKRDQNVADFVNKCEYCALFHLPYVDVRAIVTVRHALRKHGNVNWVSLAVCAQKHTLFVRCATRASDRRQLRTLSTNMPACLPADSALLRAYTTVRVRLCVCV